MTTVVFIRQIYVVWPELHLDSRDNWETVSYCKLIRIFVTAYGCFLKWWYPQSPPQVLIIFSRKTHDCWGNPAFIGNPQTYTYRIPFFLHDKPDKFTKRDSVEFELRCSETSVDG